MNYLNFLSLLLLRLYKLRIILMHAKLRRLFFQYRIMAGVEHKAVLSRKISTVVDIGANRGQFALAARTICDAQVFSFEPLPEVALFFRKVFSNDPKVKLFITAIGIKAEKKLIHLSARDDSSSLLKIGEAQSNFFPGTHEIGTLEIDVGPLENFLTQEDITRPAMLKLDVQGYELQALAGCESLIRNFNYVYCECSFVELYRDQKLACEVIKYLYVLGFNLTGVYNPAYDGHGNCIQADLLFCQIE